MSVKMPHQLFVDGEFVDAEGGKTYKTINPTDGLVRTENTKNKANINTTINSHRYTVPIATRSCSLALFPVRFPECFFKIKI